VSEHTLKAIEASESLSIAERKERLLAKAWRLANKAIDRVEDQIDGANITQATVAFGVSTDKIMLLLGELGGGVPPASESVIHRLNCCTSVTTSWWRRSAGREAQRAKRPCQTAASVGRRARTRADFSGFVLTCVLTQVLLPLIFGPFTYEKRRGRESNRE